MVTLQETIKESVNTPELIEQYKRLTGARLTLGETSIEAMIDISTGYQEKEWFDFFNFVRDYIWLPVILKKT